MSLQKRKESFENKLKEHMRTNKDLWKTIKSLGLPKSDAYIVAALAENEKVKHDTKSILKS